MCVEVALDLKKGTGVATGVFLVPRSFDASLLSIFFPFLFPFCFSLLLF